MDPRFRHRRYCSSHSQQRGRSYAKPTDVQQALENNAWLLDIHGDLSFTAHLQLVHLAHAVSSVQRNANDGDQFSWPSNASGVYTTKSVYQRLCLGMERSPFALCIWRSWAPLKCKIFAWLAAQHRLWTSDRRVRHGLQELPSPCFSCLQDEDNVEHILIQCVYAREVWHYCLTECNIEAPTPVSDSTVMDWWLRARSQFRRAERRGFDTIIMITLWALWKQRNARAFNRQEQFKPPWHLWIQISREVKELQLAGFGVGGLQCFMRE